MIEINTLTARLTDLFSHRSLASAIFRDASDMATSIVEAAAELQAPRARDEDFDDYRDEDDIDEGALVDAEDYGPRVVEPIEICRTAITRAIQKKISEIAHDQAYGEVCRQFVEDLGVAIEDENLNEAQFKMRVENSRGWDGFVSFMKEKMPMSGFGEAMKDHLDALVIQSIASRRSAPKLTNRKTSGQHIAMVTLQQLSKLTQEGMMAESGDLAVTASGIYENLVQDLRLN